MQDLTSAHNSLLSRESQLDLSEQTIRSFSIVEGGLSKAPSKPARPLGNMLEPIGLVDSFLGHPPIGFKAVEIEASERTVNGAGDFSDLLVTPAFLIDFDLMTTVDNPPVWLKKLISGSKIISRLLKPMTLFVGTTVSEYCLVPKNVQSFDVLIESYIKTMKTNHAQFTIIKDVPVGSPLVSEAESLSGALLIEQCRQAGFSILAGQALAYVDIDFNSIDEYLSRFSSTRRKDLKRKMRKGLPVKVKTAQTGSVLFRDASFVEELYSLYLNVYENSHVHFDQLSLSFFRSVFQNAANDGIVFLYYSGEKLIGWNLCFIHNNCLVDKYIGFVYPDAKQANLYFNSWFVNLQYALDNNLDRYIAGWTDPKVKAYLGAKFSFTQHAVYINNPLVRAVLKPLRKYFEGDLNSEKDWQPD